MGSLHKTQTNTTMDQFDFKNKRALIRVDFNVPLDKNHQITDDTRIRKAIPTIKHIMDAGGSVILMSHLGRPQKKLKADGTVDVDKFTLRHVVSHLSDLLDTEVQFASNCFGAEAKSKSFLLNPGQVLLLENTRFHPEESKGEEIFAAGLAQCGDIFLNDAFGSAHRSHASTTVVASHFKKEAKGFGFLMKSELKNADKVLNSPDRPLTAILGGAKVSDKIKLLDRLTELCQNIIVGGGMAYTFAKAAGGKIGNSLCEDEFLDLANEIVAKAKSNGVDLYLPTDTVIADDFNKDANTKIVPTGEIPDGWEGLDIGPETRKQFAEVIKQSKTILWNGPQGVFEFDAFAHGTTAVAKAVAEATDAGGYSLIGGGDSVAAINKAGLGDQVSFISTGGGAMLEYLEGKTLPGVKAIIS